MAKKCTTDKDLYEDVEFCQGSASLPGVRPHIYMTRRANIVVFPKPQGDDATKLEDVAVITDNFVLVENAKFVKIDLVDGESEPTSESQGAEGSKSFLNKLSVVLPGTKKKVTGLIAKMNNDDVVFLYPQRDGALRLIGNELFRVQVELGQNGGKQVTDPNQTTINISVSDEYPSPFYEGTIETDDGVISGQTDTVVSDGNDDNDGNDNG